MTGAATVGRDDVGKRLALWRGQRLVWIVAETCGAGVV